MRGLVLRALVLGSLVVFGFRAEASADSGLLTALSAPLAPGAKLQIRNVVLEDGTELTLDLTRFEPFTADAKLVIHGASGDTTSRLTSDPYFVGQVAGDPQSLAFFAGGTRPRGMISTGGRLTVFAPDTDVYLGPAQAPRLHTLPAELEVPEAMRSWKCGTESLSEPPMTARIRQAFARPRPLSNTVYYASVAIETDYEFYSHFGSVSAATQYVSDLFAAATAIYQRDVKVILQVNYLSLWTTAADPWSAGDSSGALNEFISYWQTNRTAVPRSTAHMLSMRGLGGGIAYLSQICGGLGYGVSGSMNGSFSTTNPGLYWDILVVTHEIGHNFSSPHTHCYVPPVDMCYASESGCYSGPTSVPPELGTIMSYCHLIGGYAAIKLYLGVPGETSQAVLTKIRTYVENSVASCLGTAPGPSVSTVSPSVGLSAGGTPVTITGANFVSGATVKIGGVAATGVNVVSSSSITGTTGAHAVGLVDVLVKNPDNQAFTAAGAYTYSSVAAAPTISSITPTFGPLAGGTLVTTLGTNFQSGATVAFGAVSATSVTFVSATTLLATAPSSATVQTVGVTVTNPDAQAATLPSAFTYTAGTSFYTVTPCRVADTRNPTGSYGGPALAASADRAFAVTGQCGIPATARAVSANVTITQPSSVGDLRLSAAGSALPLTSSINYRAGQTRANDAVIPLGAAGALAVHCDQPSGTVQFIIDVNGYFQ
jgi:hypothetical protein